MKIKYQKTFNINSVEDWHKYAPPMKEEQWKDGRSAKLLAEYALSRRFKGDIRGVIAKCGFSSQESLIGSPEFTTALPPLTNPTFGRHHDLLLKGSDFIIGIEAKVDEPFGRTIDEEYEDKKASEEKRERIDFLCSMLGINRQDDGVGELYYQLLTGTTGTIIEAEKQGLSKCLFLIIVFEPEDYSAQAKKLANGNIDGEYINFCDLALNLPFEGGHKTIRYGGKDVDFHIMKLNIPVRSHFGV